MVLTDDDALADRVRSLRNLCFRPEKRFLHTELGHNFRITNLQAAIGLAQLERFSDILEKKRRLGSLYTAGMRDVPDLQLPAEAPWARSVYWMYGVVLGDSRRMDAPEFARRLRNEGVETRPFFLGMHEQPALRDRGLFRGEQYPVAERIARRGLYLPSGLTLTDSQVAEVCEKVKKVLR
jgi:perosamine synthetase